LEWAKITADALDPIKEMLTRFTPPINNVTDAGSLENDGDEAVEATLVQTIAGSASIPQKRQLERKTLYKLVWSQPVQKVASLYGLSGRGLAKACKRLSVPVPPRGYWARVHHGHKPTRPPLPGN
jgi:hypothetical protein